MSRISWILIIVALAVIPASAWNPPRATNNLVIPAGAALPVRLTQNVSTKTCRVGDLFEAKTAVNIVNNNVVAIPQGTQVTLRVLEVVPGSHSSRPAKLSLEAISLTLPTGQRLAVLTAPVSKMGQVRSGQAFPAAQVIYSVPGGGTWRSIAGTTASVMASRPSALSEDVVLPPGQPLQFALSASVVVARQ